MNLLALDTATPATVVGLRAGDGEPLEARDDPGEGERPRHTTRVLALARELLERAGLGYGDLDRIAVGAGPGSFTGLRVGIATARALAQASGAELVAVSSLEALARGAGPVDPGTVVAAVIDARRSEVFAAAWLDGEPLLAPAALAPEALAAAARERGAGSGRPWLALGDGALRYAEPLAAAGLTIPAPATPAHRLRAGPLLELALEAQPLARDAVVPDYLRRPDAEMRRPRTTSP